MDEEARGAHNETHCRKHYGQCYSCEPVLPYQEVGTDTLHLYQNILNVAIDEAFDKPLRVQYTCPTLQQLAKNTKNKANARLHAPGTNLLMEFGTESYKAKANGPKLKIILRDPSYSQTYLTSMSHCGAHRSHSLQQLMQLLLMP